MKLKLCTFCGIAYPEEPKDWELFHLKYYHPILYSQLKAVATDIMFLIRKVFLNDKKKEVEQVGIHERI